LSNKKGAALLLLPLLLAAAGCRDGMFDQAHHEPYEASAFFDDGAASRPLPPNTIARGFLREDVVLYTGVTADGSYAGAFPASIEVGEKLVRRGRERYDIFCQPCHGLSGHGNGMIVQRGFKQPRSFHEPRLLDMPPGYFVNVMTQGFATMPSYASQVPHEDRWAIAAYVRALQASQAFPAGELTEEEREQIEEIARERAGEDEGPSLEVLP
jgi:mono/diheme cytochrome c family protein